MATEYSIDDVAKHNKKDDMWIVIDNVVYDVTKFQDLHPGGAGVFSSVAGKDATAIFYGLHRQEHLLKYSKRLQIGTVKGLKQQIHINEPGDLSTIPYGEDSAWMGLNSTYYKPSHLEFRKHVRKFYDQVVIPEAAQGDIAGKAPSKELYQELGKVGLLAARVGPGPWLKGQKIFNVPGEEFDYFHELIAHSENSRTGYPSFGDGLGAGLTIGLPPVFNFGKPALRDKIVPEVLSGTKRIALAISEAFAGSDVAGIYTTAEKTPDGKYWIINGTKKWITNGTFADYFSTLCKTGETYTMIFVERGPGLETEQIKTSYGSAGGTAYITYDNVKVPIENTLGEEGMGFMVTMANFNHERWAINISINSFSRRVVEECFKWSNQRKVFNRRLIDQPVIRQKLAHMVSQVEAAQNWIENITFQMTTMNYKEQTKKLAGPIALCKLFCTRVAYHVSDEACQIFGGRALTATGMGRIIERFQKSNKYAAILGGEENIMADLGIRQAMRVFPKDARL